MKCLTQNETEAPAKILETVPYERGFHFFTDIGKYTGETAVSMFSLYEKLQNNRASISEVPFPTRRLPELDKKHIG